MLIIIQYHLILAAFALYPTWISQCYTGCTLAPTKVVGMKTDIERSGETADIYSCLVASIRFGFRPAFCFDLSTIEWFKEG